MYVLRVCLEAFHLPPSKLHARKPAQNLRSELPRFAKICERGNRLSHGNPNPPQGAWGHFHPPPPLICSRGRPRAAWRLHARRIVLTCPISSFFFNIAQNSL